MFELVRRNTSEAIKKPPNCLENAAFDKDQILVVTDVKSDRNQAAAVDSEPHHERTFIQSSKRVGARKSFLNMIQRGDPQSILKPDWGTDFSSFDIGNSLIQNPFSNEESQVIACLQGEYYQPSLTKSLSYDIHTTLAVLTDFDETLIDFTYGIAVIMQPTYLFSQRNQLLSGTSREIIKKDDANNNQQCKRPYYLVFIWRHFIFTSTLKNGQSSTIFVMIEFTIASVSVTRMCRLRINVLAFQRTYLIYLLSFFSSINVSARPQLRYVSQEPEKSCEISMNSDLLESNLSDRYLSNNLLLTNNL